MTIHQGLKEENDKLQNESKKKFMILFIIFIQILGEISQECKEKATLLYKFFKLYFVEQEKKWTIVVNKIKEKIHYYKDLCKTVIQQKNRHLDRIENINDVLFSHKLTKENLDDHKSLIRDLLQLVNEKREQIYLLQSTSEILEKEIKFWVYDYDMIKLNPKIREEFTRYNVDKIIKNVDEELKHKK